jgi:hypothetical protein
MPLHCEYPSARADSKAVCDRRAMTAEVATSTTCISRLPL